MLTNADMELKDGLLVGKVDQNQKIGDKLNAILWKGIEHNFKPIRNDGRVFINRSKEFPI